MPLWHRIRILAIAAGLIAALVAFTAPAADASGPVGTYRVTVENLTDNQTLTPAVVASHDKKFTLYRNNKPASYGLQQLAENGGVPMLLGELTGNANVHEALATSGPIAPGASASVDITIYGDANRISVAAMLICTNDGFAGVSGAKVSKGLGETTRYGQAYDAGTETNTQEFVNLVPPCHGTTGIGTSEEALAENGVVRRHGGIVDGVGDLTPATHGFSGPVIKVTIERIATYEITIENLTTGQPITPAVFAVHTGRHDLFRKGAVASNGIQQLAENGGVMVLADEVAWNPAFTASTVVGGAPLPPGATATAPLEVAGKGNRFSLASMLVCTNDGFGGIDGQKLPTKIGSTRTYYANAYDAGTEMNTEMFPDLVPSPCGGMGMGTDMSNPLLAEGGTIQSHAGIAGGADLNAGHDWSDPVLKVTVERTG